MLYLTNAFSIHMLPTLRCGEWETVRFTRIPGNDARDLLKSGPFYSYFGHVDTVKHLESYWRMKIPVNRGQVVFRKGDILVIATISSKRAWKQNDTHKGQRFEFYLAEYQ